MSTPLSLSYRDHIMDGSEKRVWRNDWSGDMFEVLSAEDFVALEKICKRFSIPLLQAGED